MTHRQRLVWWALVVTAIGLLVTSIVWAPFVMPYDTPAGWIVDVSVAASITAVILRRQWASRA